MKVGDVVQLNSGSPDLTVTHVMEDTVYVTWIGENDTVEKANFPLVCLKKIKKERK